MGRLFVIGLGCLCAMAASAAQAQRSNALSADGKGTEATNEAANSTAPVPREAVELAQLLNPTEPMLALAARSFDQAFDKGMAAEGGAEALEKERPGLINELRQAIRETTLADLKADMPSIHQRYARFFAGAFTRDELAELVAFYRSPTGAKLIQAKFANLDLSGFLDRFADNPDAKVSAGDVKVVSEGAMAGMWSAMSGEDFGALLQFGLRPVAKKLKEAAPRIAAIEADIANEPDPDLDAAIEQATQRVYARHGLGGVSDR